jgi:hypothetical protein
MGQAQQNAAAFHSWHSNRTYNPGHSQIDPWMRDVLLGLQACLNEFARQIDSNTERLDRVERLLRQRG